MSDRREVVQRLADRAIENLEGIQENLQDTNPFKYTISEMVQELEELKS